MPPECDKVLGFGHVNGLFVQTRRDVNDDPLLVEERNGVHSLLNGPVVT
jgi:hypothetical protein